MLVVVPLTRTSVFGAHEESRIGTVESIVERGTYALDGSQFLVTIDKIFSDGHFYSHQAPVLATLEVPVYWVLHVVGGLSFHAGVPFDLAYYLLTLLTNGVAFALTVLLLERTFRLVGLQPIVRVALALLLPLGTWLLPFAVVPNNHGIAAALLAWVAYLLVALRQQQPTAWRGLQLGLAAGLLAVVEVVPALAFLPFIALYVLARPELRRRNVLLATIAGLALPLLLHVAVNVPITGDVVPGGFHTELFQYPGSVFDPTTLSGSLHHTTLDGFLSYAREALFTGRAYFTFAPVLLIGLVTGVLGWRWWRRMRGVQLVLLLGSLTSLGISLLTTNNYGGLAVGFRHAVYLAPACLVLLVPLFAARQPLARAAAAATAAVAIASALVLLQLAVPMPWSNLVYPPQTSALRDGSSTSAVSTVTGDSFAARGSRSRLVRRTASRSNVANERTISLRLALESPTSRSLKV